MKKWSNYKDKRSARWGVLCGKLKYTKGVGETQNGEKEDYI